MIESKAFQDSIVKPMRTFQDLLKSSYDCKTLEELATIKGQKIGSDKFFKILKELDEDFNNKANQLKETEWKRKKAERSVNQPHR